MSCQNPASRKNIIKAGAGLHLECRAFTLVELLVVIDNDHTVGDLFQTASVWPCYFFFDAEGKLRSRAAGQIGLKMAENSLKRLLASEKVSFKQAKSRCLCPKDVPQTGW